LSTRYEECLQKGKIKPFSRGSVLAAKELETAVSDLDSAEKTFSGGNYKWATIQVYYAMFHAARALIYSKNMRERSHYCLVIAVEEIFVTTKMPIITTGGRRPVADDSLPVHKNLLVSPERFFRNKLFPHISPCNGGFVLAMDNL
jgi:hypothetical protein